MKIKKGGEAPCQLVLIVGGFAGECRAGAFLPTDKSAIIITELMNAYANSL